MARLLTKLAFPGAAGLRVHPHSTRVTCPSLFPRYAMQVHGIVRRSSSFNTGRIEHLYKNPQAHIEGSKCLCCLQPPSAVLCCSCRPGSCCSRPSGCTGIPCAECSGHAL